MHGVTAARGESNHLQLGGHVFGNGVPAQRGSARRLVAERHVDRSNRYSRRGGGGRGGGPLRRTRSATRNGCGNYGGSDRKWQRHRSFDGGAHNFLPFRLPIFRSDCRVGTDEENREL